MARFNTATNEVWEDDCAGTKGQPTGFPYEFPFYFDRENTRYASSPSEAWTSGIS